MVSKKRKFLRPVRRAVAIDDRLSNAALHFLRLAAQHRGLVGHADAFADAGRDRNPANALRGIFQERLLVAAVPDVIADIIGVGEREHDEIMTLAVAERARAGGLGFLVLGLAVDDGSGGFARVFAHAFPDTHDVAAGGVDDLAAAFFDLLQGGKLGAEGGNDHDVVRLRSAMSACLFCPMQVLDA